MPAATEAFASARSGMDVGMVHMIGPASGGWWNLSALSAAAHT